MSLSAALSDLRETITEDGFTDTLVAEIAKDWEINPVLLNRKFEETHGPAADYVGVSRAKKAQIATAHYNSKVEAAMADAIATSERYSGGTVPDVVGRGFKTKDGDEYVAVVLSTRGLVAVRIHDGKKFIFGKGRTVMTTAEHFGLI